MTKVVAATSATNMKYSLYYQSDHRISTAISGTNQYLCVKL
jgi:hypothetical protein